MTLPNAILFPQALLPLYIFEPRYRSMLKKSLEEQRMFAVAMPDSHTRPKKIGGVGIIRACVDRPDGTSNLILQGVSRVRFTDFVQEKPYFVGRIEVLRTEEKEGVEVEALAAKAKELVKKLQAQGKIKAEGITTFLNNLDDYDALADILSYSFVDDIRFKQEILETLNLRERLHKVVVALNQLVGKKK